MGEAIHLLPPPPQYTFMVLTGPTLPFIALQIKDQKIMSGLLKLLCDVGNFGKIWPACRQHGINAQNDK
jgi:hypothetical protein